MKRALLVTAALAAAVAVWIAVSLPARPLALDSSWDDGTVAGILHIHTNRSDGQGDPDAVAAAAARAGLAFIVFTDHGDGTRTPDPPTYRHGVLCLDGVEVSTTGGHYVALDLGESPYPLGGEPRDVVEDVRRLGGFGIAAHPDSPKSELAWSDWNLPVDGLEILNLDTSWRVQRARRGWRGKVRLLTAIATYPFRPGATIGAILTSDDEARNTWTRMAGDWPTVGVGAADAHARVELSGDGRIALPLFDYESSFRAISVHVTPTAPLTGDAAVDGARIMAGIRHGQLYTAVDAWAAAPRFTFTATGGEPSPAGAGSVLHAPGPLRLRVVHNGGPGFLTTIFNGNDVVTGNRAERAIELSGISSPGAYWVEVRDPRHPNGPPWLMSNAIYVRVGGTADLRIREAPRRAGTKREDRGDLFDGRSTSGWTIEMDKTSLAAVDVAPMVKGPELRVRYGLSGGSNVGQFAGAAVDTLNGAGAFDRATFTIRGERPMRVSVQVRVDVRGGPPERWQRSIYVDETDRTQSVFFADMTPIGPTHAPRPPAANIRNLIFVVDTTNTKPGASGNLWLKDVRLERP